MLEHISNTFQEGEGNELTEEIIVLEEIQVREATHHGRARSAFDLVSHRPWIASRYGQVLYSHATHDQKRRQDKLGPSLHLKLGNKEDGQECQHKVGYNAEYAVKEGERDDDVRVDASTLLLRSVFLPEVRDGLALE